MTLDDLSSSNDPAILVDQDGLILSFNRAFEEAYGWREEALTGRPVAAIIPPNLRDAHHLGFSRFLATGQSTILEVPLDLEILDAMGHRVLSEHYVMAEKQQGQWRFGARLRKKASREKPT